MCVYTLGKSEMRGAKKGGRCGEQVPDAAVEGGTRFLNLSHLLLLRFTRMREESDGNKESGERIRRNGGPGDTTRGRSRSHSTATKEQHIERQI